MTLDAVANRKKIEFIQKLKALEEEFSEWCEMSKEGKPFEKHNTQIRSIQAHLEPWKKLITQKLESDEQKETDKFLKTCKNAESLILSEHRIWDYFRKKFIQRKNESFNRYLKVADEFAWICYQPIQLAANIELKEPPLVFFNGGMSPFSVSRERTFQTELVDGEDLSAKISNKEIIKLPISVVGIPWDQINHLAEASVIGHEVGHIVENDFKLTNDLERLFDEALNEAKADKSRKEAWHSWRSEIFADFYGCLSVGAAFAGTMFDYLVDEKQKIEIQIRESGNWTAYPTNILRMKIIFKILENMGFKDEIKNYAEIYASYSSNMPKDFEADIDFIAQKLLHGNFISLNNKAITEIFNFTADQQEQVVNATKNIKKNKLTETVDLNEFDIRVILAATRFSFEESPKQHIDNNYDDVIINWIENNILKEGVRFSLITSSPEDKLKQYGKVGEESITQRIDEYFN